MKNKKHSTFKFAKGSSIPIFVYVREKEAAQSEPLPEKSNEKDRNLDLSEPI